MKSITLICLFIFIPYLAFTQTVFEVEVNQDGIVFPRLTTSQRDGLIPVEGQCIYDVSTQQYLITFGFNYSFTEYSTQVTAEGNGVYGTATNLGNWLAIKLYDSNGVPVQENFQFTTFRY